MSGKDDMPTQPSPMPARVEKALAVLLRNTRTTTRRDSLTAVADAVSLLSSYFGGLRAAAAKAGISDEMARQFLSANHVNSTVRTMIKDGRIKSVDVTYRLSLLTAADQTVLAKEYISGGLTSNEVKDVVSLSRRRLDLRIHEAIKRVRDARNIHEYLIRFPTRAAKPHRVEKRFADFLGHEGVVRVEIKGKNSTLVLNEGGKRSLICEAKRRKVTKRQLIEQVLAEI